MHDPQRLLHAFGDLLDIDEVLEIEPGRHLTFEYIGPIEARTVMAVLPSASARESFVRVLETMEL